MTRSRSVLDIEIESIANGMVAQGESPGTAFMLSGVAVRLVENFKAYALQVAGLSRLAGVKMEDASRLIQIGKDLRISYEDLSGAMRFASKQGIELDIESLARLAGQYRVIRSAAGRAVFRAKHFGWAGLEISKLLALGGEGVRQLAAEIEPNLILTDDSRRLAQEYSLAAERLSDLVHGIKAAPGDTSGHAQKPASKEF